MCKPLSENNISKYCEIPKQSPIDYVGSFGKIHAFRRISDLESSEESELQINEILNNPGSSILLDLHNKIYEDILGEWKGYTTLEVNESELIELAKIILDQQIGYLRIKKDLQERTKPLQTASY